MTQQTPKAHPLSPPNDAISHAEIIAIVLNGKWWIIASTALFAIWALFYLWIATPIFSANALVQVKSENSPLSGLLEMNKAFSGAPPSETEIEVIRSRFVLSNVVETEKLNIIAAPDYFPIIGKAVARRYQPESHSEERFNSPWLWMSGFAWGGEQIKVDRFTVPKGMEGKAFTLVAGEKGQYQLLYNDQLLLQGIVGEASATGSTPNTLRGIELFVTQVEARPGTHFTLVKMPLITATQNLQQRLSVSEKGTETGVLSLSITGPVRNDNRKTLEAIIQRYLRQSFEQVSAEAQNNLEFLDGQLPEAKAEVELAESRLNRYRLTHQTADLTLATQAVLEQIVTIDTQLAQLDINIQQVKQRYTKRQPIMIDLQDQRKFLVARQKELLSATEALPKTQQDVLRLARDIKVSTLVYIKLLNKAQELKIVGTSAVVNVRILDHALSTIKPVKSNKSLIAVLAIFLGGMLGMGLVLLTGYAQLVRKNTGRGREQSRPASVRHQV